MIYGWSDRPLLLFYVIHLVTPYDDVFMRSCSLFVLQNHGQHFLIKFKDCTIVVLNSIFDRSSPVKILGCWVWVLQSIVVNWGFYGVNYELCVVGSFFLLILIYLWLMHDLEIKLFLLMCRNHAIVGPFSISSEFVVWRVSCGKHPNFPYSPVKKAVHVDACE